MQNNEKRRHRHYFVSGAPIEPKVPETELLVTPQVTKEYCRHGLPKEDRCFACAGATGGRIDVV